MPTPKNGFQILNQHLKKHIFKKIPFFNVLLPKFYRRASAGVVTSTPLAPMSPICFKLALLFCLKLPFPVRCCTSPSATALLWSPSGRCIHLSKRATLPTSCLSSKLGKPASFSTSWVGVEALLPVMCLAAFSWACSRFCRLVSDSQGAHAGAAYSATLRWVAW